LRGDEDEDTAGSEAVVGEVEAAIDVIVVVMADASAVMTWFRTIIVLVKSSIVLPTT